MDLILSLRTFCSIAEHGSLTRSAAAQGLAQSALSRQIAMLESHVNGRLLNRTGRGVSLTTLGEQMLPRAKALVGESDAMLSDLRGERASPVGTVVIGVVPAVRSVVAWLCQELRKNYPRIHLRVYEAFSGQVHEGVASGKTDIGLFNRYGRSVVHGAEPLLRSVVVLVGQRGMPVLRAAELNVKSLAGIPLAIPIRPNAMADVLDAAAARLRIELDYAFEGGSGALLMEAVGGAGMFTLVPLFVAQRDYGAEKFSWTKLVAPSIVQTTWLAQTTQRPMTPASRIVAGLLRQRVPHLAD